MGQKISVDSATLMNKGLELIEASLLFSLPVSAIQVVVHPQSIVHSLVEYVDGSTLAQLGHPDMRTPIAHALGYPDRLLSGVESLDLLSLGALQFEPPDRTRFPCLGLAEQAARDGGTTPAVLNAANEVAVAAFLAGRVNFTAIAQVIDGVLQRVASRAMHSLEDVLLADREARQVAQEHVVIFGGKSA
jgi:1-deoxy-D-xylulose-5-phosphate reductoisomerase